MFINQINPTMNINQNSFKSSKVKTKKIASKIIKLTPEEEINKLKILLANSADIFSKKIKCRIPKTPEEKSALLNMLKHRLNLDILINLSHDRFKTNKMIDEYNSLVETNPNSEKCIELGNEIRKKGNLKNYYKMNHKLIEDEKRRQRDSLDFFSDILGGIKLNKDSHKNAIKSIEEGKSFDEVYTQIKGLEEEFLEQGKITEDDINNFEHYVRKNNINKDENYNIRDLINIIENIDIENPKIAKTEKIKKEVKKPLSRKEVLAGARKLYEQKLQENIDIYRKNDYNQIAINARRDVEDTYASFIAKNPDIKKTLLKSYVDVEEKYTGIVNEAIKVPHIDLDPFWNILKETEDEIKKNINEIHSLKISLAKNKNNEELKKQLKTKEDFLISAKEEWINQMINFAEVEKGNYKIMEDAGKGREYSYLVKRYQKIQKYREALEVYNENNYNIPEEYWEKIIS